ncbi:hypothetical protein [Limosilactobacillus fermentum]|uniref:hypothetical protein n=1 Tax=Limosilactobacillus fermentum TaxID=1613 RepID=UPI0021A7E3D1|nr:hypothetical protein [Limosilactobacillus fermentum]MCT3444513.1 hypothetical protein [Limosilactobacillus fermentum]
MIKTIFKLILAVAVVALWVAALYAFVNFGFAVNVAVGWLTLSVALYLVSYVISALIGGDD